jgi:hypothetical protein
MPKMPDKLIVTGCDEKTEWQLPWFLDNYFKHNTIPIAVANFGMSEEMKKRVYDRAGVFCYMDINKDYENYDIGWFHKPAAMLSAPGHNVFWIDTDCEILGNIENMFRYIQPNKLTMAIDRPWLKRRKEEWHNSGVVGFHQKPDILKQWAETVKRNPAVGDQEVLHSMLNPITMIAYIAELPNIYNWLRLQVEHDDEDNPNKKIMHWTGEKGNDRIRGKMKIMEALRG